MGRRNVTVCGVGAEPAAARGQCSRLSYDLTRQSRGVPSSAHSPEQPRRCDPTRWVSTMPIASISANIVVGPTKRKPRFFSSLTRAVDSAETVGTCCGAGHRGALGAVGPHQVRQCGAGAQLPPCAETVGTAQREGGAGVADGGLDLAAMADDAGVLQEPLHVGLIEDGDRIGIETGKSVPEAFAPAQDRGPAQPRLEALQGEPFEHPALIAHRHAPLGVVVLAQVVVPRGPQRTVQSVLPRQQILVRHRRHFPCP